MAIYMWREQTIYDGMLGYRPLQTDLLDASGNGNNGEWYSGTGSFSTNAGKIGARVTMNSSYTSTQHIGTPITYSGSPITMCGWVCFNSTNTSRWKGLMTNQPTDNNEQGWTLGLRPADNNYPYVNAHGKTTVRISNIAVSLNTWYFWGCTWDGNTVTTYLNGTQTNTGSVSSITNGNDWRLGCASVSTGTGICGTDGWVRHCAIWDRALSAEEVQEFYTLTA